MLTNLYSTELLSLIFCEIVVEDYSVWLESVLHKYIIATKL